MEMNAESFGTFSLPEVSRPNYVEYGIGMDGALMSKVRATIEMCGADIELLHHATYVAALSSTKHGLAAVASLNSYAVDMNASAEGYLCLLGHILMRAW